MGSDTSDALLVKQGTHNTTDQPTLQLSGVRKCVHALHRTDGLRELTKAKKSAMAKARVVAPHSQGEQRLWKSCPRLVLPDPARLGVSAAVGNADAFT